MPLLGPLWVLHLRNKPQSTNTRVTHAMSAHNHHISSHQSTVHVLQSNKIIVFLAAFEL